ncbi:MAG: TauD/TfdA family dioxygenase [Betaproteobacteria bacterium]|nr:TauD/TfdA family dioxygenase [Betaproteobacteria bacterium]
MARDAIESAADWQGEAMGRRTDWIHHLAPAEIAELESALELARATGIGIGGISRENFPLPRLSQLIARALDALENGPGMFLIRGLPVDRLPPESMRMIYWGLGRHLGTAVCQSPKGDVLGDVRDVNVNNDKVGRGYQSRKGQPFHTDSCDVVGLLVLHTAKTGGLSTIVSSVALHNEILRTRPDLLEILYQPFHMYYPDWGERWWQQPAFSVHQGKFACKAVSLWVRLAQEHFPELPRLAPEQQEAIDLFQEIPKRPGFHLAMMFQPGDLQLLNNHVTLHGRTGFEDFEEPDRKRHLLRLWLSVPNSRELAPDMARFFGDPRPGSVRGGFQSKTGKIVYESLVE